MLTTGARTSQAVVRLATPTVNGARQPDLAVFLRDVPVLAAAMTNLLQHGPTAPVWHPVTDPDHRVDWMHTRDA
ncbi:hypothetical protein [Streptomyces sp. HO565]|uniref:hypothetical protein n=1 Tax=Streptomyces sp. HO565 TaxID=2857489 RepID=UPI0034DBE73E